MTRLLDPAILPAYLASGLRIARRGLFGPQRYPGDARTVCRAIIERCWTGDHYLASAGHFRQFWIRDLGFSSAALVRLGYRERVAASLAWALEAWSRQGRVTTTIFAGRRPRDVYTYGVDSLPLLLYALLASDASGLVARHRVWLGLEVERFGREVLDPRTGLVRADRRFSTHRDTIRTSSNCYANTMLVLLSTVLGETGWFPDPVPAGARERFLAAFWRGDHFVDRREADLVSGDATVFPFWLGVVAPELGLAGALAAVRAAGLTAPIPLRYAARRDPAAEDPIARLFVPDYQGSAIWTSLGAIYLALLDSVDPLAAAPAIEAYERLVERDGTLWEVLEGADPGLRPYRGRLGLFRADEGMLWSAIFLELFERQAGAT